MAYIKTIPIHKSVGKCLKYVAQKCTFNQIRTFNCSNNYSTANLQFDLIQDLYKKDNYKNTKKEQVIAHHIIQSFSIDDNVSLEEAKEIASQTVEKFFDLNNKKFQIFIATHTDTNHIHNHIVVNSISLGGDKFKSNKKSIYELRNISDEICLKYNHKIKQKVSKNKTTYVNYNEWQLNKKGYSWKDALTRKIDKAILISNDVDSLIINLNKLNLDAKILKDSKGNEYLGVRSKNFKKFYVNSKNLGIDYNLEEIIERCESLYKVPIIKRKKRKLKIIKSSSKYKNYYRCRSKYIFNLNSYYRRKRSKAIYNHKKSLVKIIDLIMENKLYSQKHNEDKPYTIRNDVIVNSLVKDLNYMKDNETYDIDEIYKKYNTLNKKINLSKNSIDETSKLKKEINFTINAIEKYSRLENVQEKIDYIKCDYRVKDIVKRYDIEDIELLKDDLNDLIKKNIYFKDEIIGLSKEKKELERLISRLERIENNTYIKDLLEFTEKERKREKDKFRRK